MAHFVFDIINADIAVHFDDIAQAPVHAGRFGLFNSFDIFRPNEPRAA